MWAGSGQAVGSELATSVALEGEGCGREGVNSSLAMRRLVCANACLWLRLLKHAWQLIDRDHMSALSRLSGMALAVPAAF